MDRVTFEAIKHKHGAYASWAVWADAGETATSNIEDLTVLDPDRNPALLGLLRNDIVMLGRCRSRSVEVKPFSNFHDDNRNGHDFKIRYAFTGTPYYGAYMTDLIKGAIVSDSVHLPEALKADPTLARRSVEILLEELNDLQSSHPVLAAFGEDTYKLAAEHIPASKYGRLVRVTSYGQYISKENYRQRVLDELAG
jgi:hypothetical protein